MAKSSDDDVSRLSNNREQKHSVWKKGFWTPKNCLLGGIIVVFLIFSIKPFLFTVGLIDAGLSFQGENDGAAIYRVISSNPSLYKFFNEKKPGAVENYLLKEANDQNDRRVLDRYADIKPKHAPGLHERFKDNFYFLRLTGTIDTESPRQWANLDNVSLQLLAESSQNDLTLSILDKIHVSLSPSFLRNLAEYTRWKGNAALGNKILSLFSLEELATLPASPAIEQSFDILKRHLAGKFRLSPGGLSENLVASPGFNTPGDLEQYWYFSEMASKKKFASGSFVMGLDENKNDGKNKSVRIMCFYAGQEKGKSRPRAGVRYRQHFPAENGFYIFSFDYCTVTGKEAPSAWFARGLEEIRLPRTGKQWKKVVIILNNAFNKYSRLNPLLRMWGTGIMKVDNVFLSKVTTTKFSIDQEYSLAIIPAAPIRKRENRK